MDDLFTGVSPFAQEMIRGYCGWHIAPIITETIVIQDACGPMLALPSLRVVTINSVTVDAVVQAVDAYEWTTYGKLIGPRSSKLRGVQVNLTHGYQVCPADLMAVARLIANDQTLRESLGGQSSARVGQVQVSGPVSASSSTGMDPYVQRVLDRYALPRS